MCRRGLLAQVVPVAEAERSRFKARSSIGAAGREDVGWDFETGKLLNTIAGSVKKRKRRTFKYS